MLDFDYISLSTNSWNFKIKKHLMKNKNIFQQTWFLRSNYNSKAISTCYNKSDALSHDVVRVVSAAHISVIHITSSGGGLMKKKYGQR